MQRRARALARVIGLPLAALAWLEDRLLGGRPWRWIHERRRGLAFVAVVIAFIGSGVHFVRYPRIQQQRADERAAAEQQDVRAPGEREAEVSGDGAEVVGPPRGVDVDAYITGRHGALAAEAAAAPDRERRVAVVSFSDYRTGSEVLAALPDEWRSEAAQLRIPGPEFDPIETEVIGGDVAASVDRALATPLGDLQAEELELARLIESGTVTDPEFLGEYQTRLDELVGVRNVIESGVGLVFAVVVEAELADIAGLVGSEGVRLVDLAPLGTDPSRSVFFGLLPEDRGNATYGRTG